MCTLVRRRRVDAFELKVGIAMIGSCVLKFRKQALKALPCTLARTLISKASVLSILLGDVVTRCNKLGLVTVCRCAGTPHVATAISATADNCHPSTFSFRASIVSSVNINTTSISMMIMSSSVSPSTSRPSQCSQPLEVNQNSELHKVPAAQPT